MDIAALASGLPLLKTGLDTLRTALGLVKDVQNVMPAGEKKEAVSASLAEAEKQLRTAEAQIAQGLGYKLCRCTFPPQIMLWKTVEKAYVCSECGQRAWDGLHVSEEALDWLGQPQDRSK